MTEKDSTIFGDINEDVMTLLTFTEQIEHFEPPEPYHYEEEEEEESTDKKEKKSCKRKSNPNKKKNHRPIKKCKIEFFTFDVCKVNKNGLKPGKMVFLTKERVFNTQTHEISWKVEDLKYKESLRSHSALKLIIDVTEDQEDLHYWFEKECNLIKI